MVEGDDLFFDGSFGDETIDRNRASLPDAVGAVRGLIFGRGIPPGVHVDDVVGGGEIESETSGFEGNQKDVTFSALKSIDGFLAFFRWGGAIEILVGDAVAIQLCTNEGEVIDKLTEDEDFVSTGEDLVDGLGKGGEFGSADRVSDLGIDEAGVAAGAAEPGEFGEDLEGFFPGVVFGLFGGVPGREFLDGAAPERFVKGGFFFAEFDAEIDLGPGGQVAQDAGLEATQEKGLDEASQAIPGYGVAVPFDGVGKIFPEVVP